MPRVRISARSLAVAAVLALLWASPVRAHARLESSVPEDGQRLERPPASISLRFTEPVEAAGSRVELRDAAGRPVAGVDVVAAGDRELTVTVPPLAAGSYTLDFTVLARDGHTTSGTVRFEVLAGATPAAPQTGPRAAPGPSPPEAAPAPSSGALWWWRAVVLAVAAGALWALVQGRRRP